jgi:hypothetical protein
MNVIKARAKAPATEAERDAFYYADLVMKAPVLDSTKRLVASMRRDLVQALARLKAVEMSSQARQTADDAIGLTFMIGRTIGQTEQALHARQDMARARAEMAWTGKAANAKKRRDQMLEDLKENGWTLDTPELAGLIIEKQGEPADEKEYKTLRRRIDRDIAKLKAKN